MVRFWGKKVTSDITGRRETCLGTCACAWCLDGTPRFMRHSSLETPSRVKQYRLRVTTSQLAPYKLRRKANMLKGNHPTKGASVLRYHGDSTRQPVTLSTMETQRMSYAVAAAKSTGIGRNRNRDGGKKRPSYGEPTSGHYVETPTLSDTELLRFYKDTGVGNRKRHLRCPHCLRLRDREHRQAWRSCNERCPACPSSAQHNGEVSTKYIAYYSIHS